MRSSIFTALAPLALFAFACSAHVAKPETRVSGSLALSTYRDAPRAVVATDDKGVATSAPLTADGAFTLSLPRGHKYRLAVATANGTVPIVFPRRSGSLDAAFRVRSNGGVVKLGAVHYLAKAPAGGFTVRTTGALSTPGTDGSDCQDCTNDDHQVSCSDGSQGHDDGQSGSSDPADHADTNEDVSVAEHNAPDEVDGCDDNEPNGDNGDDGEHRDHH